MTTNEIKWTVSKPQVSLVRKGVTIWTSDCNMYRVILEHYGGAILEDYTDEKRWEAICEPLITHLDYGGVKEGMDIANYRKEKLQ